MSKKKSKKEEMSTEQKWGIGVGLTAAAVAAAGAYFLYGSKDAEKNRKTIKSWMLKAKAEVLEKLERAQKMTKEEYEELINTIAATYADVQNASQKDIREFKKEMKEYWAVIAKYATDQSHKAAKKVSQAKKKAATKAKPSAKKKSAKKTTKTAAKAKKAAPKKTKRTTRKK